MSSPQRRGSNLFQLFWIPAFAGMTNILSNDIIKYMYFKFRHLQKLVGGFFILSCIIILGLIVIVARGQRWFQEYVPYKCIFSHAGGLTVGSGVSIQKLEAGKVSSLTLNEDNNVLITIDLFKQYQDRIRQGTLVKLSEPMIGSSSIAIIPGPKDAPLINKNDLISSKDIADDTLDALISYATDLIKQLQAPNGDLMQSLKSVNSVTGNLNKALTKNNNTLSMLVNNRELYDNLNSSVKNLDKILSDLSQSSPDLADAVVEARRGLEETNKVLMALQKSIFLRGNIEQQMKVDSTLQVGERAR